MNIHSIGPASIGGIPEEKIPALGELPKELPPPGNSLTSTDVSRLFFLRGRMSHGFIPDILSQSSLGVFG